MGPIQRPVAQEATYDAVSSILLRSVVDAFETPTELVVRSLRQLVTRHWRLIATAAAVLAVAVAAPSLARVPARVLAGCLGWVGLATALELLSVAGFVLVFTLAFRTAGVAGAGPGAGLRSLAAATLLPAGGLVGPVAGSLGPDADAATIRRLTRSSIGLVALTSAPLFLAVVVIGLMLRLGWLDGPHGTLLTLVPAAIAFITVVLAWGYSRRCPSAPESTATLLRGGLADARDADARG